MKEILTSFFLVLVPVSSSLALIAYFSQQFRAFRREEKCHQQGSRVTNFRQQMSGRTGNRAKFSNPTV